MLIYDLKDGAYNVWVRIQQIGRIVQVDVRPSDAVILAVILQDPILVARQLLEEANT